MGNELASDASALIQGIDGNWRKVDRVSGVSGVLCIIGQIARKLLAFYFGVAKLNLTFIGAVVA
jgi:hypothetical protein